MKSDEGHIARLCMKYPKLLIASIAATELYGPTHRGRGHDSLLGSVSVSSIGATDHRQALASKNGYHHVRLRERPVEHT